MCIEVQLDDVRGALVDHCLAGESRSVSSIDDIFRHLEDETWDGELEAVSVIDQRQSDAAAFTSEVPKRFLLASANEA